MPRLFQALFVCALFLMGGLTTSCGGDDEADEKAKKAKKAKRAKKARKAKMARKAKRAKKAKRAQKAKMAKAGKKAKKAKKVGKSTQKKCESGVSCRVNSECQKHDLDDCEDGCCFARGT